jgi:hypothetical protein
VWAVPRLRELYSDICLTTGEKHGKTSVRVVEKCPDIPVAVVQYTFTHWILLSYLKTTTEGWYIMIHNTRNHDNPAHRPRNHTLYDIPTLSCVFQVTQEDCPAHRPRNHTLYDIPTLSCVFQVTQEDPISSLMMAGYCQNM